MSPLLFALVTDVLSEMLSHALSSQVVVGMPLGEFGHRCNLHYADDLLVAAMGGVEYLRIIKPLLYVFEGLSGLETNFAKTCLFSTRKEVWLVANEAATLSCSVGHFPVTYLGLPISGGRPQRQDWESLVAKVRKCLSSWK